MDIDCRIGELKAELIALRRDFHQHPELGLEEFRTADKIEAYLEQQGIDVQRISETGVVGLIEGNKAGKTLLIRADIDALPVKEETAFSFKSAVNGKMHACGHDGHTAMLLVAAKILAEIRRQYEGGIKLLFQPAEEIGFADQLIAKGLLQQPTVDAALGLHLTPFIETGRIAVQTGPVLMGMRCFKLTIHGKGGHTGYPHQAIDPILTAAHIIQSVQMIQTREIDVFKPTIVMFGQIHGGTANNIVPDSVILEGSIRHLYDISEGDREDPYSRMNRIVENVCRAHQADHSLEYSKFYPAVVNHPLMVDIVKAASQKVLPESHILPQQSSASEDFSFIAQKVPSAYYFVGCGNKEKAADFHHPSFTIDEEALAVGVEMHVRSALAYLGG